MKRRLIILLIVALALLPLLLIHSSPSLAATPAAITGLHVSGNKILNAAGQTVRLLGVNRSGGEYMCVQGRGIFDGPVDATSIQYMLDWKINAVRVPLNEDCWLAINGVAASMSGSAYQQAVINYVNLLNSMGIIVILDLHWGAPGTTLATAQTPMPDADHTPAFWQSVATTFKGNSSVIFDLFNEPYPDSNSDSTAGWTCWRDGGTCAGVTYQVAGFQSLVNTVRATGATNIIMLGGLEYSNALSQWLTYKPTDSTGNLVASWHSYNFNVCAPSSCWNSVVLPVMNQVPVITGEMGENDCAHTYIDPLMSWLDTNGGSYLAWTWDAWGICASGPVLINDYLGNPTAFGQGLKDHLNSIQPGSTVTPLPTSTVGPGVLNVVVENGNGDNTQQSDFKYEVANASGWPVGNVSVRIYFTVDGSTAPSLYVLDANYDQSGVAKISGPIQAFGSVYYFSIDYGSTQLGSGSNWQFQGALHLSTWASTVDATNDWFHTGYAVGAFPAAYTSDPYFPGYVNGALAWGQQPSSGGTVVPTTPVPATNTATKPPVTNTPTFIPPTSTGINTATHTPTATSTCACITNTPTKAATATSTPTSGPTATKTPTTDVTPTPTKTFTPGPTKTNTPIPSATIAPTKTNTPLATNTPNASDPCASPTVITGGGSFTVSTAGTCFKYVNTTFVNGGMFSVMKDSSSASDTLKWYGGMDQNATACANQSSTISGNGGQLNNFVVARDANGQMFLTITGSASNSVTLSIQNWQNGAGCSVKPTVHP